MSNAGDLAFYVKVSVISAGDLSFMLKIRNSAGDLVFALS